MYFVLKCIIYNYADDNTVAYIHKDLDILKLVLENESLNLISWFENNFMNANPKKFRIICIGKKSHDNIKSFTIEDTDFTCDDNVTLLGINIDFMLKFDDHVSDICRKASKQLVVLKRIGRFLTKQGKMVIYNSFIASNFSYCPLAWHFCSSATNKLAKIQERELRFLNNDFTSSLPDLVKQTNTQPLNVRRMKLMACEVYKIVNDLSPKYINDLVNIKHSSYNFRSEVKAEVPQVNSTRYGLRSFRSEAPRIWNSLPVAESYKQVRKMIQRWGGFGCQCPIVIPSSVLSYR